MQETKDSNFGEEYTDEFSKWQNVEAAVPELANSGILDKFQLQKENLASRCLISINNCMPIDVWYVISCKKVKGQRKGRKNRF